MPTAEWHRKCSGDNPRPMAIFLPRTVGLTVTMRATSSCADRLGEPSAEPQSASRPSPSPVWAEPSPGGPGPYSGGVAVVPSAWSQRIHESGPPSTCNWGFHRASLSAVRSPNSSSSPAVGSAKSPPSDLTSLVYLDQPPNSRIVPPSRESLGHGHGYHYGRNS